LFSDVGEPVKQEGEAFVKASILMLELIYELKTIRYIA